MIHLKLRQNPWIGWGLLGVIGVLIAYQNCSKSFTADSQELQSQQTPSSVSDLPSQPTVPTTTLEITTTTTTLPKGPDPSLSQMGTVSYGLFNKLTKTNGVVPAGQLGKTVLIRSDTKTFAYITALGLTANQTYHAHVHTDVCSAGAGGHYKKDPSVTSSVESNEIWVSVNTDAQGVGSGRAEIPFVAGPEAKSVVIHDLDDSKFYCADLITENSKTKLSHWSGGTFQLASTAKPGTMIKGNATKVALQNGMTGFHITVWGLTPGANYPVHIHSRTCASGGGGHFLIDASKPAGMDNEVWMPLKASDKGSASSEIWINQITQTTETDASSIVIHDPTDSTKLACADLTFDPNPLAISGHFQMMDTAVDHNLILTESIQNTLSFSSATLFYSSNDSGTPKSGLDVQVYGLPANLYHAHIHNRPCRMGAGSHYKLDPSVTAALETNEVWASLQVGNDQSSLLHLDIPAPMRSDAMSMVVHDPTDSSKLLCADLF